MKFYVTHRVGPKQTDARRTSVMPRSPDGALPNGRSKQGAFRRSGKRRNPVSDLHPRSAGGLTPIVAPHSEESSMDFIGRPVERF
jgi:hypothetical protein